MKSINTFEQLLTECTSQGKRIWQVAQAYESEWCEVPINKMRQVATSSLKAMKEAIRSGLNSTEMSMSGMCGDDCNKLQKRFALRPAIFGKTFEKILTYSLATSEENIRMGKIVACPTAGSCGIVPAVITAISEEYNISEERQVNALITAGEIGRIISARVPLAGAVAGCQAECGAAAAMAAGAVTQLLGGEPRHVLNAVALTLKNILGLTCDPVCGLVEVPCVKRNPFMAVMAITACELAISGVESKIPVDEVVDAMEQTGQLMSPALKESSMGGLARTKTAVKLQSDLFS